MFQVQRKSCSTCIYSPASPLNIKSLEAQIADPVMPGFFKSYRVCHHSDTACCAGFWARHKNHFALGQIAQRLGCVERVEHDNMKDKPKG